MLIRKQNQSISVSDLNFCLNFEILFRITLNKGLAIIFKPVILFFSNSIRDKNQYETHIWFAWLSISRRNKFHRFSSLSFPQRDFLFRLNYRDVLRISFLESWQQPRSSNDPSFFKFRRVNSIVSCPCFEQMRTDDGFHNWLEEFSLNRENFEKGNDVPIGEKSSIVRDTKFDGFVLRKNIL